eukprot:6142436-Amphidinium_carterae.1
MVGIHLHFTPYQKNEGSAFAQKSQAEHCQMVSQYFMQFMPNAHMQIGHAQRKNFKGLIELTCINSRLALRKPPPGTDPQTRKFQKN